jgi:hypothetical protein
LLFLPLALTAAGKTDVASRGLFLSPHYATRPAETQTNPVFWRVDEDVL